ncbi:lamin tail domain-containing protein, partial [Candidatus Azambacteria bacterium]|nr:lamin tail domain-containing protein [Candidatus Azambacteria bacterium]
ALSLFWNFGDGFTDTRPTTTHAYKRPGRYVVTLAVSDGASTSTAQIITAIYPRGIVISEFLPNTEGKDEEEEWIELWNGSEFLADLSDWKLSTEKKSYAIPPYTALLPKSYLVLERQTTKLALANTGGTIELETPEGFSMSSISYEKAPIGQSSARQTDGTYQWTKNPSPGSPALPIALSPAPRTAAVERTRPAQESLFFVEGKNTPPQAPAVITEQDIPRPLFPSLPAEDRTKAATAARLASLTQTLQSSPFLTGVGTSLVAIGALLFLRRRFRRP